MAFNISEGLRDRLLGDTQNLIGNGSFVTDCSSWSSTQATPAWTASGQSGYCMRVTNSTTASGYASQSITVKPEKHYVVEVYFKKGSSVSGVIMLGINANDSTYESKVVTDVAWTKHIFYVTPTTSALFLTLKNTSATSAEYSDWDEIRVLWDDKSLRDVMSNGKLTIYSGSQPSAANDSPVGTALVVITTASSGNFDLMFESPDLGVLTKQLAATWSGTALATASAGWFRFSIHGDNQAYSATDCRIDGSISTSGAELNMASVSIVATSTQSISVFQVTIPATII